MNWKRGLLRLWAVGSTLWIVFVGATSWETLRQIGSATPWENDPVSIPVDCKVAQGTERVDYRVEERGPWTRYRKDPSITLCWYTMPKVRELFPQYADVADDSLAKAAYAKQGLTVGRDRKWDDVANATAFAFIPPLMIFAIGGAFIWVLLGFVRKD